MSDSGRHYPDDETRPPHRRTELEVRAARKSGAGCCNDYANNMGCACLADALNYEAGLRQTTPSKPEVKEPSPLAQAIRAWKAAEDRRKEADKACQEARDRENETFGRITTQLGAGPTPRSVVVDGVMYYIFRSKNAHGIEITRTPVEILE